MTWTPSPADEVPNPAGINSLRKMFGFNLSSKGAASNKKKSTQSKGEQTGQQGQEQELQQQEFKEEHAEEGEERAEAESSGLSVERQGDMLPAELVCKCRGARRYVVLLPACDPCACVGLGWQRRRFVRHAHPHAGVCLLGVLSPFRRSTA